MKSINVVLIGIGGYGGTFVKDGNNTAIMNNGEKIVCGDPMADNCRKLHMACRGLV